MKNLISFITLVFTCFACSLPDEIKVPPFPNPPNDWYQFSVSTVLGSDCPIIEGEYLEPPSIHRTGKKKKNFPKDNSWLYFGYIPLHRAERRELPISELDIGSGVFVIRQPDASRFYFSFLNHKATAISEYFFSSNNGDFECHGGHIEFPQYNIYGMIEGMSMNFQIRNALLRDVAGGLVIQSARGPYRGNQSRSQKKFTYEFFRYPPVTAKPKNN